MTGPRSGRERQATFDWLVVDAGFVGAVLAEHLAHVCGERVLVVDRRDQVVGQALVVFRRIKEEVPRRDAPSRSALGLTAAAVGSA